MARQNKQKILTAGAALVVCFMVFCFTSTIKGNNSSYEVKPPITISESRTDAARAIDAYERVMDRFMDITQSNLAGITVEVHDVVEKLIVIDNKITQLNQRLESIEKRLAGGDADNDKTSSKSKTDEPEKTQADKERMPWE